MAAPRLLDKKLIHASLANDRKQEIDKGIKVAKAVDTLRETRAKEEQELEDFRVNSLKVIHAEIASAQKEAEQLLKTVKHLKEEKIRASSPPDLRAAWDEVHQLKEYNQRVSDDLLEREIHITERENNVRDTIAGFEERERQASLSDKASEENLRESEEKLERAREREMEAEALLAKTKKEELDSKAALTAWENELNDREISVVGREEQVEKDKIDITNRERLLADRQALLARGFEELRRKQS